MAFGTSFDNFSPSPTDGRQKHLHNSANEMLFDDFTRSAPGHVGAARSGAERSTQRAEEATEEADGGQTNADNQSPKGSPAVRLAREAELEFSKAIDAGGTPPDALEKTKKKFVDAIKLADETRYKKGAKLDDQLLSLDFQVGQSAANQARVADDYDRVHRLLSLDDRIRYASLLDDYTHNPDKKESAFKEIDKHFPHMVEPLRNKKKPTRNLRL